MQTLDTEDQLRMAVAVLVSAEPRFGTIVEAHGLPPLRRMQGGLVDLLRIVTDQMISLKAGEAIWHRLAMFLNPFDANQILQARPSDLMDLGLSGTKARTFLVVADAVVNGSLDFGRLHDLPDEEATAALASLPGIGPWTAEIYLLGAMGRCDAWPAGDLALQVAVQHLFELGTRPDARAMRRMAAAWQPWRAVAARLLWSYYRGVRGLAQAVS